MRIFALVFAAGLSMLPAESVESLVARGDKLDAALRNREALVVYRQAESVAPGNAVVLQRIAKQYSQLMAETSSKAEKLRLGRQSIDYATRAVEAAPDFAEARLSLAICYGKVAFLESPRKQVEASRLIKSEAEAAVRLDPRNDYAWHVLGRWNYELANFNMALRVVAQAIYGRFPDASNKRAAECFEKAVALQPGRVLHHTELGRAYLALGRKDDARRELKAALSLPDREKDDEESKVRARKALDTLR